MASFNSARELSQFLLPASTSTLILSVVILLALGLILKHRKQQKRLDMPGPWSLPFTGCMYLFRWFAFPHKTLTNLAWIYGSVYSLTLGNTNVVVISFSDAVKEALYQKGSDFAGRPALFSFDLWTKEEETLMFKDYSLHFSNLKYKAEISMQELLNDEEFLSTRISKAVELLNNSFEHLSLQNSDFDPEKSINDALADFVMDTVFGHAISRWFYHEARFILKEVSSVYGKKAHVGNCMDFLPLVRHFKKKILTNTRSRVGQLRAFVRKVYRLHQHSLMQESDLKISLAYCLRSEDKGHRTTPSSHENNAKVIIDDDILVFLLTDIMFCAYEKLSTSFRWCVARLASNMRLQRDILEQDNINGSDTRKRRFSLLAATIDEVLRTSCIMPFGITRKTTRDTTLKGYHIPKNTVILFNLWSCCHDSKCFSNPEEFDPYRYDNATDTSTKLSSFCVFSGGERKCLGDNFSRKFLVALTAGVLRTFELELVTPGPKKSFEGVYGLTLKPKNYTICVRKRSQNAKAEDV